MMPIHDEIAAVGLLKSLKSARGSIRRQAIQSLSRCPLEPPIALRQFTKALSDPEPGVRRAAVPALGQLGLSAVPALLSALADSDPLVRREAVWALGRLGPPAAEAVPALMKSLEDPDGKVRLGAARALGLMGPAAAPATPGLIQVLHDTSHLLPRMAAWALSHIGPAAVPALAAALESPDPFVRADVLWALADMGPAAQSAVPALIRLLHAAKDRCLTTAAPIEDENSESEPTAPIYIRPRRGTEEAWLVLAIKALAAIGPDAQAAVPALTELARAGWGTIQVSAAEALIRIGPERCRDKKLA
jgi:HEAT repeat protein